MAGGGQGAAASQGNAGIPADQAAIGRAALQGYNPQAQMQQYGPSASPPQWANVPTKPLMIGQGPLPTTTQGYADGGQIGMNSYADPSQNFMQYQGQGQPNQPMSFGLLGNTPPVQGYDVPDATGRDPSNNMGFDGSGSDSGVAGRPVDIPQNPLQPSQQGNKPLGLAQFQQPQGLQIAGNPTSQIVQRPQQR